MTFARLLRRRAHAQRGLLALVGLLAALVSGTLVAVTGYVSLSAQAGLVDALRDADPADAAAQLATPRSSRDPVAQVTAAEAALARTLDGLPVRVHRSARSTGLTALSTAGPTGTTDTAGTTGTTGTAEVVVGADPDLRAAVEPVAGSLPPSTTGGGPAAGADDGVLAATVSRTTADALGLAPGDRLALAGAGADTAALEVEVAAVWEPVDPADPRWFEGTDGVLWVDESALDRVPATVRVRWTLVPDPVALGPSRLPELRDALAASLTALRDDDAVDELGVLGTDGLATTLAAVDRTLSTVRALSVPAALLAVLVGLVVLLQLAGVLADVRRGELVLLRSRGATHGRVVGAAAVEGVVVGTLGAAVGAGLAVVGLRDLGAVPRGLALGATAAVAAAVALALAGSTWRHARRPLREPGAERSARGSALLGGVLLAAAAGAAAVWRLLDLGSPVRTLGGRASPDPVASAAVPLALLAVALVAGALVPLGARTAGRTAARRGGLGLLAVQQVAHRPAGHAATAALTALATATAVAVAGVLGTWAGLQEVRSAVETGAQLRVVPEERDAVPLALEVVGASAPGGTVVPASTVRAASGTVSFGDVDAALVAVPRETWPLLRTAPQDDGVRADAPAVGAPAVPDAATTLRLTVAAQDGSGAGAPVAVTGVVAWLRTAPGTSERVELAPEGDGTGGADGAARAWAGALPAGTTRLLAVDVTTSTAQAHRVRVGGFTTDAGPVTTGAWQGLLLARSPSPLSVTTDATGAEADVPAEVAVTGAPVRVTAVPDDPLPVVASRALVAALALEVSDTTTLAVPRHRIPVRIDGVLAAVPGTADPRALLVDLDAWTAAQLATGPDAIAPSEVWVWPTDGAAGTATPAALEAAGVAGAVDRALPREEPLLQPALTAYRVAAWATLALAVGGVLAAARAAARSRRAEIGALRGAGVPGGRQARLRLAELLGVLLPAALLGAAGGWGLAALVARPVVEALYDGALPLVAAPAVDGGSLALWLGATTVAVALVVASTSRDTARRARTASVRPEAGA